MSLIVIAIEDVQLGRVLQLADQRVHTSPEIERCISDLDAITAIRAELQAAALAL